MSLKEGLYAHLFLYHPESLAPTRITYGDYDDIHPAVSPDGRSLAFASNRSGFWDLFIMDLDSGMVDQLTHSPGYEGAPTWSPDGAFIAYESLIEGNLDISLVRVDSADEPLQLTNHSAADHSPAWSPGGREIAFISTRSGLPKVWLADLQNADDRFRLVSPDPESLDSHPAWSPDGTQLAWASNQNGQRGIYIARMDSSNQTSQFTGSGDWPAWNPTGDTLLSVFETPNQQFLTAYRVESSGLVALPPLLAPGPVIGLDWADYQPPSPLPAAVLQAATRTPPPLYLPKTETPPAGLQNRSVLATLVDVEAPDPRLIDDLDEAFQALRQATARGSGWDFLANLENAYVPLTAQLPPGLANDWLYTGRAFAANPAPTRAGWMVVTQELFGSDIYWRVYIRARFQDGSQGIPIREIPFDLEARFEGDPLIYEAGGAFMDGPPDGYWIDFTELARSFGWQRLPALLNWRTFYQGARFNEFVQPGGLDWRTAMLSLYPPEALITPSPITPVTPTLTPTRTATPTRTPTATITPTFSPTPLESPTFTVIPGVLP